MNGNRAILKQGKQRAFIKKLLQRSNRQELARLVGYSTRTATDWLYEKVHLPEIVLKKWCTHFKLAIPPYQAISRLQQIKKAAKKGGQKSSALYGSPGTPQGRSKGGRTTIKMLRKSEHPAFTRKHFHEPKRDEQLAECFGIILGDGGISNYQVTITLGTQNDLPYVTFVEKLFSTIFKIKVAKKKHNNAINLTLSSASLVEFLEKKGLKRGSKVAHQIDIPWWIKKNHKLLAACVRGLVDTDGCVFIDHHKKNKKIYKNPGICFTNHSVPLLQSVFDFCTQNGYYPTRYGFNMFIRREKNVINFITQCTLPATYESIREGAPEPKKTYKIQNVI